MTRVTRSSMQSAKALPAIKGDPVQLSSPPPTPAAQTSRKRKVNKPEEKPTLGQDTKIQSNKRTRKTTVKKEDVNELPHNLGAAVPEITPKDEPEDDTSIKTTKKPDRTRQTKSIKKEAPEDLVSKATEKPSAKEKTKANNNNNNNTYGLTPGHTPYPNYPHPTAEECEEVTRVLSKLHGKIEAPKSIPTPSLSVSGCGEVPSVLDALIRTRLSAATSGANSSRAFAGLVSRFGVLESGSGKGSVDWNAVRLSPVKDVYEAIKSGGLADVKSRDIKRILDMVWAENQAQRAEGKDTGADVGADDATHISLDHLHALSNDDAFAALTRYPGIGPKTASCVLLFCLQRPSFAVDTHVFRLCKWLGWVPPAGHPAGLAPGAKGTFAGPTRNSTYAHCEVRVPDHLKYPLHALLIRHGKTCPRCRAITGESSEGWGEGCAIEHLVTRSGARKGGAAAKKKGRGESESESESEEMSGVGSSSDES